MFYQTAGWRWDVSCSCPHLLSTHTLAYLALLCTNKHADIEPSACFEEEHRPVRVTSLGLNLVRCWTSLSLSGTALCECVQGRGGRVGEDERKKKAQFCPLSPNLDDSHSLLRWGKLFCVDLFKPV